MPDVMKCKSKLKQPEQRNATRDLLIVLDIEFDPECPPTGPQKNVSDIEVQLNERGRQPDFIIETDRSGDGYRVQHEIKEFDKNDADFDDCPCCIFRNYDCVPHISKSDGATYVTTFFQDRETRSEQISVLREACSSVRLVQITVNNLQIVSQIKEIDLASLSEKQFVSCGWPRKLITSNRGIEPRFTNSRRDWRLPHRRSPSGSVEAKLRYSNNCSNEMCIVNWMARQHGAEAK